VQGVPEPPPGEADDDRLFATIAALVPPTVLAELLAERLHLPVLESDGDVGASANELLAAAVATRCGIVPVAMTGQTLEVATANPLDLDAVKTVEFATGKRVRVRVATPETVRRALGRLYGEEAGPAPVPVAPEPVVPEKIAPEQAAPIPAPEPMETGPDDGEPAVVEEHVLPSAELTEALMDAEALVDTETLIDAEASADTEALDGAALEDSTPSAATDPEPARTPRVLVMVGDAVERERLGGAVREGAPAWLVVTAQDAGEGDLVATVVHPDVVIVDSATTGDLATGCLAACPLLVADEYDSVDDVLTLARTLIDTARSG